jgi:type IV pilus assembly protein PilV
MSSLTSSFGAVQIRRALARESRLACPESEVAGMPASVLHGRRRSLPATSQTGVGLIEVLVAVLVLSIAFLGIAALQALSLSTSNSAMAHSMATISSYSILDAMRADSANAKAGLYNNTGGAATSVSSCPATTSTLQGFQINQWCTQLGQSLGQAASTKYLITCGASSCNVTITLDDSRAGTTGTAINSVGSATQQVVTVAAL